MKALKQTYFVFVQNKNFTCKVEMFFVYCNTKFFGLLSFLDSLTILRKATNNFFMSACLSFCLPV